MLTSTRLQTAAKAKSRRALCLNKNEY